MVRSFVFAPVQLANQSASCFVNATFLSGEYFGCWSETQQRRAEIGDIFRGVPTTAKYY